VRIVRNVPWWGLVSSAAAPVLLVGGWRWSPGRARGPGRTGAGPGPGGPAADGGAVLRHPAGAPIGHAPSAA